MGARYGKSLRTIQDHSGPPFRTTHSTGTDHIAASAAAPYSRAATARDLRHPWHGAIGSHSPLPTHVHGAGAVVEALVRRHDETRAGQVSHGAAGLREICKGGWGFRYVSRTWVFEAQSRTAEEMSCTAPAVLYGDIIEWSTVY